MNLIDLTAYTMILYLFCLVMAMALSWVIHPKSKWWNKILWPGIGLVFTLLVFGWTCKSIGWDPLLW